MGRFLLPCFFFLSLLLFIFPWHFKLLFSAFVSFVLFQQLLMLLGCLPFDLPLLLLPPCPVTFQSPARGYVAVKRLTKNNLLLSRKRVAMPHGAQKCHNDKLDIIYKHSPSLCLLNLHWKSFGFQMKQETTMIVGNANIFRSAVEKVKVTSNALFLTPFKFSFLLQHVSNLFFLFLLQLLQGKSIHYPSGYPMTRSPPFLVSSSPGPDPYRSNDNVYEELGPGRVDSDGESEPPLHSDDDFAEDELSLPGECSFQKETNLPATAGATPYHERAAGSSSSGTGVAGVAGATGSVATSASLPQAVQERHSVLSSGSSMGQDTSTATASSASNNNHELASGSNNRRTGRTRQSRSSQDQDLNNSTSTADIADLAPLYDNRSNLMSLGYVARSTAPQFYNTLEHEVERRNRINAQLSKAPVPPLSTIYRERIRYPHASQQYPSSVASGLMAATMRARTQPRVLDRRLAPHQHQHHRIHAAPMAQEPSYCYAEPMYNANYYYESAGGARPYASTLLPTAADYRHPYGDSSFGSDSGYSHHTPASSIGRQDYDVAEPQVLTQPKPSKLSSALNFSWNRNSRSKGTSGGAIAKTSGNSSNSSATSPNNNSSACSTVTSQLENNNTASLSPA